MACFVRLNFKICLVFFAFVLFCGRAEALSRVITLYPGHTDNIIALGCGGLLVGVSENDDPETLPDLLRLPLRSGAEAVLALKPDLVISRSAAERINPALYQVLRQAGVTVEILDPPGWDDFPEYLRKLSALIGADPEVGIRRLEEIITKTTSEAADRKGRRPLVFLEATAKELHTCAPNSWAAHLMALAGGINAAESAVPQRQGSSIAPWGLERVLKTLNDGLDVYIIQKGTMNASTAAEAMARPWGSALAAVKVVEISESMISRPSLLGLEKGAEQLLKIFDE